MRRPHPARRPGRRFERLTRLAWLWLFCRRSVCLAGAASPLRRTSRARPIWRSRKPQPASTRCCGARRCSGDTRLPSRAAISPKGVRDIQEPIVQQLSDSLLERRWIDAGPDGLAGQRIDFPGPRADDHRGRRFSQAARRTQPDGDRPSVAALGGDRAVRQHLGDRRRLRAAGFRAHSVGTGSSAVRLRPAAPGAVAMDAGEDDYGLHPRPQPDAGGGDAWLCATFRPRRSRR